VARIWLSSPSENDIYNGFWYPAMETYEEWAELTYPDRYEEMFHAPCCDYDTIKSPSAVALHKELMPV
jgi:hypothetical protein